MTGFGLNKWSCPTAEL